MTLTTPAPFTEADDKLAGKDILATTLSSRELALHARPDVRDRSFFSARVVSAQILGEFKKSAQEIVAGKSTFAQQRLRLKQLLASIDYKPAHGKEGTIEDLGSNQRLMLMLKINVSMVRNFGQWQQMNRPGALKASPALELIRISDRVNKRFWVARWNDARDRLLAAGIATTATEAVGGRDDEEISAFAMKNDPIWEAISRFGLPYPPFDFQSGMGVREVGYREAVHVGVMKADDQPIAPKPRRLNDGLESSLAGLDDDLTHALDAGLSDDVEIAGGVLRFKNESLRERTGRVLALMNAFDPLQPRGPGGRWISIGQVTAMHARAAKGLPVPERGQRYRAVSEAEAQRVQRSTGIDVRGLAHSVDGSALRHIIKNHGDPAKEKQRGLVAITSQDIAQLPRIMARADRITRLPDSEGHMRICYEKIQGGCVVVVEEVRLGRHQLALVTMYKKNRAVLSSTPGLPNAVWQTPKAFRAVPQLMGLRDRGQAVLRFLKESGCT